MKQVYIARHDGVYLGGYSVIFADSADDAITQLSDLLATHGLQRSLTETIERIEPNGAHLIWNGDY